MGCLGKTLETAMWMRNRFTAACAHPSPLPNSQNKGSLKIEMLPDKGPGANALARLEKCAFRLWPLSNPKITGVRTRQRNANRICYWRGRLVCEHGSPRARQICRLLDDLLRHLSSRPRQTHVAVSNLYVREFNG